MVFSWLLERGTGDLPDHPCEASVEGKDRKETVVFSIVFGKTSIHHLEMAAMTTWKVAW